jgi:serine/threonine protein kinase
MSRKARSQSSWAEPAFAPGGAVTDEAGGAVYEIRRFIGRGGMGEVYEAVQQGTGARFALKCLRIEWVKNTRTLERARREALTLRDLHHPNVVRVHATGVLPSGVIWMLMDLLEGHTLAHVVQRLGKLPLPWVLRIGRDACAGLAAVHAHAIHRDVKPENLHLGNDAVVRVLDLGTGKFHRFGLLTTGAGVLGTVPYMAPEQIRAAAAADARSDIFSLAVVLAELASGVHPFAPQGFAAENVFSLVRRIVGEGAPPLVRLAHWVPAYVAATIDRALAADPAARYADAVAFGEALASAQTRLAGDVGTGAPLSALVAELRAVGASALEASADAACAPTQAGPFAPTEDADTLVMGR